MRRFRTDESGQSLLLVVVAMTVILAVAAFAIDAASWMARHHQAQVVADSAALAAANCLANPGSSPGSIDLSGTVTTVPACSSSTDTTAATAVAELYARANGVTLTNPSRQISFDTGNDHVTIDASAASSSFFAGLFGIHSTTQSAGAQAKWTAATSTSCASPGNSCAAVFAMGTSCTNSLSIPGGSPIIFNGSTDTLTGLVHSNGSIYEAGGGGQTLGPTTFGNGAGCEIDTDYESGDTWDGSSTKPSSGEAPIMTWPQDFTKIVTACGSGHSYACTGPAGTPSYCTEAAGSRGSSPIKSASATGFTYGSRSEVPPSGQVWCAYGSGTPSDPSTWNGLIYLEADSTAVTGNWIGGTIEFGQNGWKLSPKLASFPVLYATGGGDCSSGANGGVCMTGGSQTVNGSVFAPNGWIQFNGAGSSTQNFLEAQGINFIGGQEHITGDGPSSLAVTTTATGSDSLTQ